MKKIKSAALYVVLGVAFAGLFIMVYGTIMENRDYKIIGFAIALLMSFMPFIVFVVSISVDALFDAIEWLKDYKVKHIDIPRLYAANTKRKING